LDVPARGLSGSLTALYELGFDGLNVTVPHKRAVIPHLAGLSEEASLIGAVNTLIRTPEGFLGRNTDAAGFTEAYLGIVPAGARTLILGAGGAARAVARALASHGIAALAAARDKRASQELAAALGFESVAWTDLPGLAPLELVVNATSASSPAELGSSAPDFELAQGGLMVDLNYGRPFNHFRSLASKSGAVFRDGLAMLAAQARGSFKLWTGEDPGCEPFTQALARAFEPEPGGPRAARVGSGGDGPGREGPNR
jgi:shikimate dehydrogenase